MNVLITSVGRRAYMVRYFKNAVGVNGRVVVCNSDSNTSAFRCADTAYVSPLIFSDEYIPFLLTVCRNERIDILVSLFDIDLPVLAAAGEAFESIGVRLIVPDEKFVRICNDKLLTYRFFAENGFNSPRTYAGFDSLMKAVNAGEAGFPVMVKPRFGCGSIGINTADDEQEAAFLAKKVRELIKNTYLRYESSYVCEEETVIFQEFINGQEYGADVINDLDGNNVSVILRKKTAMRSGETDIAEIVENDDLREMLERLGGLTGHIGNLDCDIILCDGIPYILEMNARFGGGYPFSHESGCDLPGAICSWVKGEYVDPSRLRSRAGYKGCKELVITEL